MPKFKNESEFAAHYEKLAREEGGRNDYRLDMAKCACEIPSSDQNHRFYEDSYVRVLVSLDSQAMSITRKANNNPVYWRTAKGEVARTHGEWTLCRYNPEGL